MTTVRWALLGLLIVHVALGWLYVRATPMFEASDEGVHYGVIEWLKRGNGLPVQDPAHLNTIYGQEGSQPPLYYLMAAALTWSLPTRDFEQVFVLNPNSEVGIPGTSHNVNLYRPAPPEANGDTARVVWVVRWFSLVLSTLTVALTYALARQLQLGSKLAWGAAALVAFNPMALFINAAINNDNLLMTLSTATLVVLAHLWLARRWPTWRLLVLLGGLLGLAVLTKVSGLVLWPVVGLGLLGLVWRQSVGNWRAVITPRAMATLSLPFVVAGLVCGWWFIRNLMLYGELLGTRTMVAVVGARAVPVDVFTLVAQEWYSFYMAYWGVFGAFTLLPHPAAQVVFHGITLGGLVGGVWALLGRGRGSGWGLQAFLPALLALFVALTLAGVVQWSLQTPASQGRLLFGAIAPLSLGLAVGLHTLNRRAPWLAVGALLACAAWIPMFDIAPRYTPPPFLDRAALPADLRPVRVTVGDGLELLGYLPDPTPRRPGEAVQVTLFWRVAAPLPHDDTLALAVLGRNAEPLAVIDTWPGAGLLPMADLPVGAIFADRYALPVPAQAHAPTVLRLLVGAWRADPANRLPLFTPDAQTPRDSVLLEVGALLPAWPFQAEPARPRADSFEHGVRLLGYDAERRGTPESPHLVLTLYWQASQPVPADYTLFVHGLEATGQQVFSADAPPLQGDWPTSRWQAGAWLADARQIDLPPNLPSGGLTLRLGWYDPTSGARLTAYDSTGARWPDDAVLLPVP